MANQRYVGPFCAEKGLGTPSYGWKIVKTRQPVANKAGNDKEDTCTMVCILLKYWCARRIRPGPQLRKAAHHPTELLAQTRQQLDL